MIDNIISKTCFITLDFEDIKITLKNLGITIFGTLNTNKQISEKEIIENLNYPFYNKTLKDSKKILVFLDTLEEVELTESQIITDVLMNETKNKIKDVMFSMRIDNSLKNRVECSFIAGVFRENEEEIKVNKEVIDDETEDISKALGNFLIK